MAWADDPVQYSSNSSGQTTRVGTVGGVAVNDTFGIASNGSPGWIPNATPTGPVVAPPSPPPSIPPHLQFSANTIGTTIFLAIGRCRLPGQIIWAPGIDATNSVLDTSLLTFAAAYCEPIDSNESVRIQTMSANGTKFYDFDAGGVILVPSITIDGQLALQNCIDSMAVYTGDESQLPDPTMESYLGAGEVPAYRGLRYIVFQDFPLEISNNSVPNIIIEWRPIDDTPLNVSDVMVKLISHVDYRSEYMQFRAAAVLGTPEVIGIDDQCLGLVITSQSSLIDHFTSHRNIYNFQIKEGDPIKIVRREVGSSLVIDMEIDEADLISAKPAPAMVTSRANPAEFPVGMNLTYIDPDHAYDTKVAPAMFDGSQPGRSSATSSSVLSAQMDYVVDATTARSLAYSAIFNLRSYAGRVAIEMDGVEAEVGDTIAVTTREGDEYVILVDSQTITKNRSNAIQAMQLLTQAGADVDGDGGNDGGSTSRKYWPEDVLESDFLVNAAANKIWSMNDKVSDYRMGMSSLSAPTRRISSTRWRNMVAKDPSGLNWGGDAFYSGSGGLARLFEDDFYVYWLHRTTLVISRLLKTASNINAVQTLTIPQGFYVDGVFGHDNVNVVGNQVSIFRDGKLYIAWNGRFAGVGSGSGSDNFKLIVVDVEAWSASAFTAYDYFVYAGADQHFPKSIGMADNGTIVIATNTTFSPFAGAYYYANISDLTSWSSLAATFPFSTRNWQAPNVGDKIYFAEAEVHNNLGEANRKTRVGVVDVSGSISEAVVDLNVKDANFLGHSQVGSITMWASDTHLFVYGNHTNAVSSTPVGGPPFEHRYIGRFDASTLDAAGGKFLYEMVYNENDFQMTTGRYFGGKVYCSMTAWANTRLSFLSLDDDLTSPHLYWTTDTTHPSNDDFANPLLIFVGASQTGDLLYGSTETDEPVPGYATTGDYIFGFNNCHSAWYRFVAPATATYTIVVEQTGHYRDPGVAVYTGTDLASLTYVTGALGSGGVASCSLSATSGTVYSISVRIDSTTLNVFGGALDARPNHGRFTVGISGPVGGGGVSPSGAPTITSARPAHAATSAFDIASSGTIKSNHITMVGTADAGASVHVFLNGGGSPTTVTADGSGDWTCDLGILSDASQSVTATQTSGGVTSAASSAFTFTVAPGLTSLPVSVGGNLQSYHASGQNFSWDGTVFEAQNDPSNSAACIVTDTHTLTFTLLAGDVWAPFPTNRDEISSNDLFTEGQTINCTYEFMLSASSPVNDRGSDGVSDAMVIGQVHTNTASLPAVLAFFAGPERIAPVAGDGDRFVVDYVASNAYAEPYRDTSNMTRGVWYSIEFTLKVDRTGGTGIVKVWRNGTNLVNLTNVSFGSGMTGPYYWKLGIYRGDNDVQDQTQIMSYRNMLMKIV